MTRRARWPKECPVFEVTESGRLVHSGAIAVAIELPGYESKSHGTLPSDYIGVQLLSGINYNTDASKQTKHPWRAGAIHWEQLRPLTPAAKALLALVRRG